MAGLLDDPGAADDTFQGVPSDASQALALLSGADSGGTQGDGGTSPPATQPAAPPAEEPSFLERLSRGIGKAGMVLAGGDPELATLTPDQQRAVGLRSLLHASLSMLANSGPSYTPRNFGQILAAGLESAGQVPVA